MKPADAVTLPEVLIDKDSIDPVGDYIWTTPEGENKIVFLATDPEMMQDTLGDCYMIDSMDGFLFGPFSLGVSKVPG